jgi:thiol-disulfide isomerase/thioredoxin
MKKIFLLLCCLSAAYALPAASTPGEIMEGKILREAPMQGLSGNSRMLSDFRGKPLVINVWASHCPPCLAEMGSLERLARRYEKKFTVIGISTDDYRDRAQAFLQKSKTTFPHFIDQQLALENMLGADRIPLTLLIDGEGRVLHKIYGAKEWDSPDAVAAIGKAFKFKP